MFRLQARQLESEIRLMEKLTHPNIVGLLGTERFSLFTPNEILFDF